MPSAGFTTRASRARENSSSLSPRAGSHGAPSPPGTCGAASIRYRSSTEADSGRPANPPVNPLFAFDAKLLDELAPFRDLGPDVCSELLRRVACNIGALVREL